MKNLWRTVTFLILTVVAISIYGGGNICVKMIKWNNNQGSSSDYVKGRKKNSIGHVMSSGVVGLGETVRYTNVTTAATMEVVPLCGGKTNKYANTDALKTYTVTESDSDNSAGKVAFGDRIEVKIKSNKCTDGQVRYSINKGACS
jgi:hypothetical protein